MPKTTGSHNQAHIRLFQWLNRAFRNKNAITKILKKTHTHTERTNLTANLAQFRNWNKNQNKFSRDKNTKTIKKNVRATKNRAYDILTHTVREWRRGKIWRDKEFFPELMENTNPQIPEYQQVPGRINLKIHTWTDHKEAAETKCEVLRLNGRQREGRAYSRRNGSSRRTAMGSRNF